MRRLTAALLALVLAAAGVLVWLVTRPTPHVVRPAVSAEGGYRVGTLPGHDDAPVAAAVEALPLALGYDYRTLETGLSKATGRMTPGFAREFRHIFEGSAGRLAEQEQATTQALVRGAGLVRLDGSSATCIVFVDQLLVSSKSQTDAQAAAQISQNRVVVKLRHLDGKWLVDGIDPF